MKRLFVVCIALLALLTFACRGNDNQAAQAAPAPVVVEAVEVVETDDSEDEIVEEEAASEEDAQ